MGHLVTQVIVYLVIVAPLVDTHFLADQGNPGSRAPGGLFATAKQINGNSRLMAVGHGSDDIFRPKGGVATKEHARVGRLEGFLVQHRHTPFVEHDTDVALNPGEGVFLANCHQHIITGEENGIFTGGNQVAASGTVVLSPHLVKTHAHQLAILDHKFLGHMIVDNGDIFMDSVFFLPRGGLHIGEGAAHQHLDIVATQATAAVHGGVAATQHNHLLANALGVLESHAAQPVDANMDMLRTLLAAREVFQVATAGRARTDKNGVIVLLKQALQAVNIGIKTGDGPHPQDVTHLFVQHFLRQPERGNLAAHKTATGFLGIKNVQFITEGGKVAGHGQGSRTGTNQGNALAVLFGWFGGDALGNVVLDLVVGGNTLEAADGYRLFFHPATAAGGLTGAVTGTAENAREDVGFPVDHVGIVIAPLGDQADVFRNRGVRRTGVLAINNFMKILRMLYICRLQKNSPYKLPFL